MSAGAGSYRRKPSIEGGTAPVLEVNGCLHVDGSATLRLMHKPDLDEARKRWRAFWAGEIIDRPCVRVLAPKDGVEVLPYPPSMHIFTEDYRGMAEQYDRWAAAIYFGGEAIPSFMPNFGPDQFAAFFGAELEYSPDSEETTWAVPCIEDWSAADHTFDAPGGKWWRRMLEFIRAIAEAGEEKFIAAAPDLHGNMDCLAAMRGPQRLCEDLIDAPDAIDRAMRNVRRAFPGVYNSIHEAGRMASVGTSHWLPYYCEGRFLVLQCDFVCMIGPEHSRRFVIPALEEEAAFLDHCVYHLDGPDALVHLEDILAIKRIDGIQWVPGAGNPSPIEWLDLLHRIQDAGKGLYLGGSVEDIKAYHKELRPEKVFYNVWAASQAEADALLNWLKADT